MRHLWTSGVLLLAALAGGCGGSSSTGQLRFMQAAPISEQVQLLVNGTQQATNLNYVNATGYLTIPSGSQHVQVVPVSGSTTPVLDTTISINNSDVNQTLLMIGTAGAIHSVLLNDANTTATTGDIHVRVLNASNHMGAADVYILPAGSSILGATPVANGPYGFGQNTGYQLVATGGFQVVMAVPGTTNAVLSTGTINPTSSATLNQTVVVLDNVTGGFTFSVLQDQ